MDGWLDGWMECVHLSHSVLFVSWACIMQRAMHHKLLSTKTDKTSRNRQRKRTQQKTRKDPPACIHVSSTQTLQHHIGQGIRDDGWMDGMEGRVAVAVRENSEVSVVVRVE